MILDDTQKRKELMKMSKEYPILLTRQQAAELLGIDPKSFDKYIRNQPDFPCIMIGKHQRFLKTKLLEFLEKHCTTN